MIPTRIEVANYRSFVDPTVLELRPLTLLFGRNNCGKSSLLRLLPLLADSLKPESQGPIDLASGALRGASFSEVLTRRPLSSSPELHLAVEWGKGEKNTRWQWTIRSLADLDRQFEIVSECQLSIGGEERAALKWLAPLDEEVLGTSFSVRIKGMPEANGRLDFQGLIPRARAGEFELLEKSSRELMALSGAVQWLGSVRSLPPRVIDLRMRRPKIDPTGLGATELLVNDFYGRKEVFPAVSRWFEETLEQRLDVEARADSHAVVLSPLTQPTLRVNLVDTGEGITQVLPVLVALERALKGQSEAPRLVAVEQPELHLHPAAQTALADRFCTVAAQPKPPVAVVETHSENFLLSIQLAVLEQRLAPERIAAYWVRRLPDGRSQLIPLEFDALGHPRGWPPGVFEERTRQSRQIVASRQKRRLAGG